MATWGPRLISSDEAAKLADLTGARDDLEAASGFCDRLAEVEIASPTSLVMLDALSTAIAVRYARCFTTGVRARLSDEVLAGLSDDLRSLHAYLLVVRNKHVAHSVNALEENHVTIHVREPPDAPALRGVGTLQARSMVLGSEDAPRVRELCRTVVAAIDVLIEQQRALVEEHIRGLSLDEVYALPKPKAFEPDWARLHLPRSKQ
ncbi:MAG: hypothetical protein QOF89_5462 [Acidobacteriota bacterium]|jgi:hypothetical protein|nr:hypothetical protein [Acidobacteriota bacterium]